jgi:hypothetical protein
LSSITFIQVSNKWLNRKWYVLVIQVLKQGERYTNKWIQLSYKAMRKIGLLIYVLENSDITKHQQNSDTWHYCCVIWFVQDFFVYFQTDAEKTTADKYKDDLRRNCLFVCLMVFNATFNNISVISWRSVLLVEETGGPEENHWPVASHWQTLSHNVVHLALIVIMGFFIKKYMAR